MCRNAMKDAFRERLSAYADGELGLVESGRIAWHLRRCAACASELMTLRRLNMLLRDADVAPRSLLNVRLASQEAPALSPAPQARPAAASGSGMLAFLVLGKPLSVGRYSLRAVLPSLALVVFAGLALVPATRSVIRHHVRTELLQNMLPWNPVRAHEIALRHPQDLQIQMAFDPHPFAPGPDSVSALTDPIERSSRKQKEKVLNRERVAKLQKLAQRFPNAPS